MTVYIIVILIEQTVSVQVICRFAIETLRRVRLRYKMTEKQFSFEDEVGCLGLALPRYTIDWFLPGSGSVTA